jgi:hypothetical protein
MQKEKEFLREEIDHLKRRAAEKQQEADVAERALAQYHASDAQRLLEAQKQIFLGLRVPLIPVFFHYLLCLPLARIPCILHY